MASTPKTDGEPTLEEARALAGIKHYADWDSGYSKQQSTRPQTVGYGLTDSPAGQAAWIPEKFWAWTDCDGHPENVLGRDELLDNVMLYWVTATAASSARLYWESFGPGRRAAHQVNVPTGVAVFPKESSFRCLDGPEQKGPSISQDKSPDRLSWRNFSKSRDRAMAFLKYQPPRWRTPQTCKPLWCSAAEKTFSARGRVGEEHATADPAARE